MASPSTHQGRKDLQPRNENERLDVGEDPDKSPHTGKSFNDSPYMDQGPNERTHQDGCVNESPLTDHDGIEHRSQSEDWSSEDEDEYSYWAQEYAGHVWNDDRGWGVLKPGSPPEPWWIENPPLRSPSDPDYLCEVCRHINFCWLFENNMSKPRYDREKEISVGTAGRILKQTTCSFCVLLATSCWRSGTIYGVLKSATVGIESTCFSQTSTFDCNHPKTEVKYLSISALDREVDIQVLDDSQPMRGRQISPYIKQPQQNMARQWLKKCEHEHCPDEDAVWVTNLALIDLKQRCIVRPDAPVRYAALSYVWGTTPQKMYSTSTQQEFETKGTLHSKQSFLPQTITDAMDLAAHIGLHYLWVDSLCILQDDEANRNYFIGRMGSIYGTSAITIVDAHGSHSGSGLTGMSSPRANRQRIATVQGMQLCATAGSLDSPWQEYFTCSWLKRGWTYQEMLLSKRLLLVTYQQLQFICNHTVYLEEVHPHSPRTSDWTMPASYNVRIRRSAATQTPIKELYSTAVERFTQRDLTHEVDVVPAFDAIFKALYNNTKAKSLFNLPDIEAEETLLWECGPYNDFAPLSVIDWSRMARRRHPDRLPTWSWAGWRGEIEYPQRHIGDTPLISAVLWRCAPTSAVNTRSEFALQDYRCTNWREKGWNYKFLPDQNSYAYTHDSRPNVFFQNPIELEPDAECHKPSFLDDSNVLHFSAFTVHISAYIITPGLYFDNRGFVNDTKKRHIFDSSQYLAGSMTLDCLPTNGFGLRLVALARCSKEGIQHCEQLLGVNLRDIAPLDWDPTYFNNISQPNHVNRPYLTYDTVDHWDKRRFQDKFYPLYGVLLVEMREGTAYRIGCGRVHIDAFHAANPIWEEVRLG